MKIGLCTFPSGPSMPPGQLAASGGSFFASEDPAFGGESGIVAYDTTSGAESRKYRP